MKLVKKKRERSQINKIRNERELTTNTTEIQSIVRNYYEQLYAKNLDNLGKMDKFLEIYNLPKLNQEADLLNRPTITNKIEAVIKKLQTHKNSRPDGFKVNFTKHSKN